RSAAIIITSRCEHIADNIRGRPSCLRTRQCSHFFALRYLDGFNCGVETDKRCAYRVSERYRLNLRARMAGIDANLDDLQAGVEASSRAANTLESDTTKFDGLLKAPLLRAVLQHVKELQACTRDQRAALEELRDGISRLQAELTRTPDVVKPPPLDH